MDGVREGIVHENAGARQPIDKCVGIFKSRELPCGMAQ